MRIGEVSKQFNLSIHTLRYYEKIGLLEEVQKENGVREYGQKDFDRLNVIECLKKAGMSLESINKYFEYLKEGDTSLEERLQLLYNQLELATKKINEIQESIDFLHYKIDYTKGKISERDKK